MSSKAGTRAGPKRTARLIAGQDWYFALALALFVGVTVWFSRSVKDFIVPPQSSTVAPSFVGQTVSDALSEAKRAKLRAVVVARQPSDRFPKEVVMRQQPDPGTAVREGRQISLVVSTGEQIFAMPDLRYESMREVGLDLSHFKLQLGKSTTVANDEIPANHVVKQDPQPLSGVRVGSIVNLEISKGPPPNIRVPNFSGMSVDRAREEAIASKVRIGQIVWTPFGRSGPARGVIVRQSPPGGVLIDSNQRVSLQVSAGPREAGYIVRQVHATASVPAGEHGPVNVRIEVRDDTGTWNVYSAFAQPRQKLDFNLTVVGTSEMDMYVNNELESSTRLGVEPALPDPIFTKEPKKQVL